MLLNCGAREDSWETLDSKEIKPVNLEGNQPWILIGRIDAEAEAPILPPVANNSLTGKKPWCWERLKAEGEEGDRGCDGWMASPIQWTWTWAKSGRWWGTGKPSVLQSVGLQRVRHDLATEQQQNKGFGAKGRIQPILNINRKPLRLQFLWFTKRIHRRRGMETFASYLLVTVDVLSESVMTEWQWKNNVFHVNWSYFEFSLCSNLCKPVCHCERPCLLLFSKS